MANFAVDIVIPWVDGSRSSKELLELWLIGALKYATWAHKIFIVVDRLTDLSGMDIQKDNIEIVYHDEFIPKDYLPTFNSNVIECFAYLIPNLAEHFVLFNDDCYLVNKTTKEDFFTPDGRAIDTDQVYPVGVSEVYSHTIVNNLIFINGRLNFKKYRAEFFKRNLKSIFRPRTFRSLMFNKLLSSFHGWQDEHIPIAYTRTMFKQTFGTFDELHHQLLSGSKFRKFSDVSHLLVRFWRLAKFDYSPRGFRTLGVYTEIEPGGQQKKLEQLLEAQHKIICVNDIEMSKNEAQQAYDELKRILTHFYGRK